jgi:hypothetical protein
MRWARMTIAGSMGLIALVAIGLAALRHPTPLVASGIFSLVILTLFAASVVAISLPGRSRAVWSSFVVCGSGYLLIVLGSSAVSPYGNQFVSGGLHLITEPLIEIVHERMFPGSQIWSGPDPKSVSYQSVGRRSISPTVFWNEPIMRGQLGEPFMLDASWTINRIYHSLLGLAFGTFGALFALFLTGNAEKSRLLQTIETEHKTPRSNNLP